MVMTRKIKPVDQLLSQEQKALTMLSALTQRLSMMSRLGTQQYGGSRDIYEALGYKKTITFVDYFDRYTRQDMAKAIIDRPVKATWQGPIELVESEEEEDTEFEKEWLKLNERLKIKTCLTRVDRLTRIGEYGILLLGLDDTKKPEDFVNQVASGRRKLLYIKPFSQDSAIIDSYVSDPRNERYGLPEIYRIVIVDVATKLTNEVKVHHSRIIHIVEDNLESEVLGTPCLEVVFNRLMDLEKVVGGDAEMFWRGARPGYAGDMKEGYTMTDTMIEDLKDQIDEFEHNLRRILVNEGITLKELAQQVADPKNHVDIIIQMISAVTGIPKRILTGSERGELSSVQDSEEWRDFVQARREDHAEPNILRPLVDRLIKYGVLPTPENGYDVKWQDLYSISEKERVNIGKGRAEALREYTTNPIAVSMIPPKAFIEYFLGMTTEQITLISAMVNGEVTEEVERLREIMDVIEGPEAKEETTPAEPAVKMKRTPTTIKK